MIMADGIRGWNKHQGTGWVNINFEIPDNTKFYVYKLKAMHFNIKSPTGYHVLFKFNKDFCAFWKICKVCHGTITGWEPTCQGKCEAPEHYDNRKRKAAERDREVASASISHDDF